MLQQAVRPGDTAVDGTTGNGHDTLLLAELVGDTGNVHGFDLQEQALAATRARLEEHGLAGCVRLHNQGHEHMAAVLGPDMRDRVAAVVYNLGFLPRSDKRVVTRPETTLDSLEAALWLLRPGGVIAVVCYTGHEGGSEETHAVGEWATGLDPDACRAVRYETVNRRGHPIVLYGVEKLGG